MNLPRIVWYALGSLFLFVIFYSVGHFYFQEPAEDALILFCFSENFANTGVISYYPGGPPAEGATDFLWMIVLAALYKIGIPSFAATHLVSAVSFVAMMHFLNNIFRHGKSRNMKPWEFVLVAITLLSAPYFYAMILGFSVYFFALFIASTLYYFLIRDLRKFALSGLLLCLIRPDGAFLCIPLAFFILTDRNLKIVPTLQKLVLFAGLPGVLYFLGRYAYFGEWMPLPFYVKSTLSENSWLGFDFGSLKSILSHARSWMGIFVIICFLGILLEEKGRRTLLKRSPVWEWLLTVGFICVVYARFKLEQNVGYRFFILWTLPLLATALYAKLKPYHLTIGLLVLLGTHLRPWGDMDFHKGGDIRHLFAKELNTVEPKGSAFIGSAGALAYYSKWEVYDTWGLATAEYSKSLIPPEAIKRHAPDIIFGAVPLDAILSSTATHCFDASSLTPKTLRSFSAAENNVTLGAYQNGYIPYMLYHPKHRKGYAVFLKRQSPVYDQVLQRLKKLGARSFCEELQQRKKNIQKL